MVQGSASASDSGSPLALGVPKGPCRRLDPAHCGEAAQLLHQNRDLAATDHDKYVELVTAICLQATERRGMVAADYAGRAAAIPAAPVDLDVDPAPTEIDSDDEDFYSGTICHSGFPWSPLGPICMFVIWSLRPLRPPRHSFVPLGTPGLP